jgi:hypothetical protein
LVSSLGGRDESGVRGERGEGRGREGAKRTLGAIDPRDGAIQKICTSIAAEDVLYGAAT